MYPFQFGGQPSFVFPANTSQMGTSGRQSKDPSKSVGEDTFRLNTDIAPPSVGKRGAPRVDIGADTHSAIFNSLRPAHWRLKDSLMD